ncbi:hypothetical protein IPH67_02835 [bacterium]|nr:MAG: hypothetical protein IPH67_02835 [bacterium]
MFKKRMYAVFFIWLVPILCSEPVKNQPYSDERTQLAALQARADEFVRIPFEISTEMKTDDIVNQPSLTVDGAQKLSRLFNDFVVLQKHIELRKTIDPRSNELDVLSVNVNNRTTQLKDKIGSLFHDKATKLNFLCDAIDDETFRSEQIEVKDNCINAIQAADNLLEEFGEIKTLFSSISEYEWSKGLEGQLRNVQNRLNKTFCVQEYRKTVAQEYGHQGKTEQDNTKPEILKTINESGDVFLDDLATKRTVISGYSDALKNTSMFSLKELAKIQVSAEEVKSESKKFKPADSSMQHKIDELIGLCDKVTNAALYKWKKGVALICLSISATVTAAAAAGYAAYKKWDAKKELELEPKK